MLPHTLMCYVLSEFVWLFRCLAGQSFMGEMKTRRSMLLSKTPVDRHKSVGFSKPSMAATVTNASSGSSPAATVSSKATSSPKASPTHATTRNSPAAASPKSILRKGLVRRSSSKRTTPASRPARHLPSVGASIRILMLARRQVKSLRSRLASGKHLPRRVITRTLARGKSGRGLLLAPDEDAAADDAPPPSPRKQPSIPEGKVAKESPTGRVPASDNAAAQQAPPPPEDDAQDVEVQEELLEEEGLVDRLSSQVAEGMRQLHQLETDRTLYDGAVAAVARHQELVAQIQEKKLKAGALKLELARHQAATDHVSTL